MTPEQLPPLVEPITQDIVDCWRVNYGLDTRSPADAARYWSERCAGMAPAVAVAALGLALLERDRLRAEMDALRRDAERYRWLRERYSTLTRMECAVGLGLDLRNVYVNTVEKFDAAIDAAMKETP